MQSNWFVSFKYGVPVFNKAEPTFRHQTTIHHLPLLHASIGLGHRFHLTDNLNFITGITFEHGHFLKFERYKYTTRNGDFRKRNIRERFRTFSLQIPMKLIYKRNKVSFSAGVAYVYHLSTKVTINRSYWENGIALPNATEVSFSVGDDYLSGSGLFIDRIKVDLDRKVSWQAIIGFQYQLGPKLLIDFEIQHYLKENVMTMDHLHYDAGSAYDYFNPYPRILSIGISYDI